MKRGKEETERMGAGVERSRDQTQLMLRRREVEMGRELRNVGTGVSTTLARQRSNGTAAKLYTKSRILNDSGG